MWDLPGPGLEPVSPALAGGFLTTVPPGKSPELTLDLLRFLQHSRTFTDDVEKIQRTTQKMIKG